MRWSRGVQRSSCSCLGLLALADCVDQLVESLHVDAPMQTIADRHCRAAGALAEAVDRLERELAIRGGLVEVAPECLARMGGKRVGADGRSEEHTSELQSR